MRFDGDHDLITAFEPVRFVDVGMIVWALLTLPSGQRGWVNCRVTMAAGYHARVHAPHHGVEVLRHIDDLRRLPADLQRQITAPSADRIAARGGLDIDP